MIQLYECPTCERESSTFVVVAGTDGDGDTIHCPACSPTPDKTPHDYQPVMLAGTALKHCCGDAGDCSRPCDSSPMRD